MAEKKELEKIGIYLRLSRDDEKAGESMSIEHQRIILRKYAEEHGGKIVDEYADDGFSGTNFDRPGVQRLLSDAQTGKIDTILVKDLSRFGRNYIQVGQYIDYIFPAYGIRFIALNDNVDTADRSSAAMDMMPIMNVFNEWHAASTSKKIRSVLDASRRAGKFTNWNYPYGYRAGTNEKRSAVVDEEAANVVRRIFDLRLRGNSVGTIARILSDEGIPNPASHYTRLDGGKWERNCSPLWAPKTVRWILSNPVYLGSTVQHKTTRVSYKNHQVVNVPESEWIVTKNAHEPLVSQEIWDKVQESFRSARGRTDKTGKIHPLSGLVVCADCGKKLKLKRAKNASGCFLCRTYVDLGKQRCSSHRISEETLEKLVLQDLRALSAAETFNEERAKERFLKERSKRRAQGKVSDEKQLKACQYRLKELDKLLQSAFEEKILQYLPEDVFSKLCEKYRTERESVLKTLDGLKARLFQAGGEDEDAEEFLRRFRRFARVETLTREMCQEFIEEITVGERKDDGEREICISYKFLPSKSQKAPE